MTSLESGVIYPKLEGGKVSTLVTGKAMLASSIEAESAECARSILKEKNWRQNYTEHIANVVRLQAASKEKALSGAQAGLDYVYDHFKYGRNGETVKLGEFTKFVPETPVFSTDVQLGDKIGAPFKPSMMVDGSELYDKELNRKMNDMVEREYIENSAKVKTDWVVENTPAIGEDLENVVFVVFGAGSALGPFEHLLRLGRVSIAAIDLPRPQIWDKIFNKIETSSAKVFIPKQGNVLGCDIIQQAPELVRWLTDLEPGKRLVLGNYAYADGANFIKVVLAMDAICAAVAQARGRDNVAFSYLCSPTDIFTVPDEVARSAQLKYDSLSVSSLVRPVLTPISMNRFLTPNFETKKDDPNVVDCVILQQGPNYAMAKRIQHWRAMTMREKGYLVSSNIAPASETESVTKNAILAAAYNGSAFFDVHIFKPETANSMMTLQLIHDVCNPAAGSHIQHPFDLFVDGACHGNMWRIAYRTRSVTEVACILYFLNKYKGPAMFLTGLAYALRQKSKL